MGFLIDKKYAREVWSLALPVVIGMVSQTLLGLVDTAMVGRLGPAALAAAGLGGMLTWLIIGSLSQLAVGVQAVSSRRFGEKRLEEAGETLTNALLLAIIIGCAVTFGLSYVGKWGFQFFTKDPEVVFQGQGYIYYRLLGGLPYLLIVAYKGFFNGVSQTKLHMRVALLINGSNIVLNYLLIFGKFGFPRMETHGAGLSSAIGTTLGMIYFVLLSFSKSRQAEFNYYRFTNLKLSAMKGIMRLAVMAMVHSLATMTGFTVFNALVARLGTIELAVTNVIMTIISFSFLPGAGIGVAAASLIGKKLGEKAPFEAERCGWEAAKLGMLLMGGIGIIFISIPKLILLIFTDNEAVISAAVPALRIMGFVQIFDACGMVFSFALEGAGLSRWIMLAETSVNWLLFIPLVGLLAFYLGMGVFGAWLALAVYLVIYGMIVTIKFHGGSWKTAKV